MRLAAPVLLAWLVTGVCGNGLRAAYEKLMLFHSYQIDQLLPEDQQTIGIRCAEKPLRANGPCPDPAPGSPWYIRCEVSDPVGSAVRRPCKYLWEFMEFIDDKENEYKGKELIRGTATGTQNKLDFDIDETARNLNEKGFDKQIIIWRVYKDTASLAHIISGGQRSYNAMLSSVYDSVAFAKSNLPKSVYEANKHLFERFDTASSAVTDTRMADYHRALMTKIQENEPDIRIASEPTGWKETVRKDGQVTGVRELRIFNEGATIDNNIATMPKVKERLDDQVKAFQKEKFNAGHMTLIQTVVMGANDVKRATPSCNN